VAAWLRLLTQRFLVPRAVKAFFVALAFPLLCVLTLISQFFSSFRMLLSLSVSFSQPSVWAWACDAVSFLAKDSACELPPLLFVLDLAISLASE
jgi:hypothetical protein